MKNDLKTQSTEHLFSALLCLENEDECREFLKSVCTPNEISSMAGRFEVAYMLRHGCTYTEISEKTGASTVTISRVRRSLEIENNGYDIVFERMKSTRQEGM